MIIGGRTESPIETERKRKKEAEKGSGGATANLLGTRDEREGKEKKRTMEKRTSGRTRTNALDEKKISISVSKRIL